jgi:uncharacterized protein DUF87
LSSSSPFIPRLVSSNLKNFFLGSAHSREVEDTRALHERARAAYRHHRLAAPEDRRTFVIDIVWEMCEGSDPRPSHTLQLALCTLVDDLLTLDGLSTLPEVASIETLSIEESIILRNQLWRLLRFIEDWDHLSTIWRNKLVILGRGILDALPASAFGDDTGGSPSPLSIVSVPLISVCREAAVVVERTMATMYDDDIVGAHLFEAVRDRFEHNLCAASGIPYDRRGDTAKTVINPTAYRSTSNEDVVSTYLGGTPFGEFFTVPIPFSIPEQLRFEHTHILAGSGHGKTQTLQHLILSDLTRPDPPSLVIIDSQGDMIKKLSHLEVFDPKHGALASKLIVINPADVEYPPALNMFDVNFDRLDGYRTAAREQILNGVIELYDYIFGSLLGAELTQKQSVIFRYLARLMLTIPGATIHTLIELMNDTTPFMKNIEQLPPGARMFFETEFPHKSFTDTKRQIQRRLWGILENPTFERMLTAPKNRIDMFDALNTGKIVLVNTAKDFLKGERSSFLGRFFIALTLQAALERAALPESKRRPAFLYIDEAADYFDDNIDDLLTQARKYNLGVVFSHQYLDQLAPGLRSSIASNTSIKLAGGISDRDARSMAPDMRTTPTFLLEQRKAARSTQFACYLRNITPNALSLSVPFGAVEQHSTMSAESYRQLENENRGRISLSSEPTVRFSTPDLPWKLETGDQGRHAPNSAQKDGEDWSG